MIQKGALQKWIKIVNWCKAQINFGSALYNSLIYTTHNLVYIRLILKKVPWVGLQYVIVAFPGQLLYEPGNLTVSKA